MKTVAIILACALSACADKSAETSNPRTTEPEPSGSATLELDGDEQALPEWSSSFRVMQEDGERDTLEFGLTAENVDEGDASISVLIRQPKALTREPLSLVGVYETEHVVIEQVGEQLEGVSGATVTVVSHAMGRIAGTIEFVMDDKEASADFEGEVGGSCHVLDGEGWKGVDISDDFCAQYFQ
jgi:hypothetical protein